MGIHYSCSSEINKKALRLNSSWILIINRSHQVRTTCLSCMYTAFCLLPFFLCRLSDYDSLVQLGAKIGVKIRDRDEQERGSLQRNKVSPRYVGCLH